MAVVMFSLYLCTTIPKGTLPGVYVQETTGEPGSIQNMLIRGLSSPVFSKEICLLHNLLFILTASHY